MHRCLAGIICGVFIAVSPLAYSADPNPWKSKITKLADGVRVSDDVKQEVLDELKAFDPAKCSMMGMLGMRACHSFFDKTAFYAMVGAALPVSMGNCDTVDLVATYHFISFWATMLRGFEYYHLYEQGPKQITEDGCPDMSVRKPPDVIDFVKITNSLASHSASFAAALCRSLVAKTAGQVNAVLTAIWATSDKVEVVLGYFATKYWLYGMETHYKLIAAMLNKHHASVIMAKERAKTE